MKLIFLTEGLAAVKIVDKWGFIDTNGDVVIDFVNDYVYSFTAEIALVREGER